MTQDSSLSIIKSALVNGSKKFWILVGVIGFSWEVVDGDWGGGG